MEKKEKTAKSTKAFNLSIIIITAVLVVAALGAILWFTVFDDIWDERIAPDAPTFETDSEGKVLSVTPRPELEPADTIQVPWAFNSVMGEPELEGYEKTTSALVNVDITNGLSLVSIGSYSGLYIEEGRDTEVHNVLAITVYNGNSKDLQYAEIFVSVGEVFAQFDITCLPAGSSVTVLEKDMKNYTSDMQFKYVTSSNVAFFSEPMPLHSDVIFVTCCEGYINVTNMSETDIDSDVVVYYKQVKDGRYFGGITYTVTIKGGIGAKSSVMMSAPHFVPDESEVMFVVYDEKDEQ